jgi:hypothetical protein
MSSRKFWMEFVRNAQGSGAALHPESAESNTVARKVPSYVALEKAYWVFVDAHCPHPVQSRHRYTWVRENLSFEYDGVTYMRTTEAVRVPAGTIPRAAYAVTYTSTDGEIVVEDEELTRAA